MNSYNNPDHFTSKPKYSVMLLNSSYFNNTFSIPDSTESSFTEFYADNNYKKSAYKHSKFPGFRNSDTSTISAHRKCKLNNKLAKSPIVTRPKLKDKIPIFTHALYKKFLNTKSLGYKCQKCRRLKCGCGDTEGDPLCKQVYREFNRMGTKRFSLINEMNEDLQKIEQTKIPISRRSKTPSLKTSSFDRSSVLKMQQYSKEFF